MAPIFLLDVFYTFLAVVCLVSVNDLTGFIGPTTRRMAIHSHENFLGIAD